MLDKLLDWAGDHMRRIRLIIEYDGTGYVGWQIQSNGIAVQYVIERELNKLTGENCVLHASGRTDSGVHAYAQVAHLTRTVGFHRKICVRAKRRPSSRHKDKIQRRLGFRLSFKV